MEEFSVSPEYEDERLDKYLTALYPERTRSFFQQMIRSGQVLVNGIPAAKTGLSLKSEDLISVSFPEITEAKVQPEDIPLDILYEDAAVLVVNKPKGMVVHPAPGHFTGTLVNAVLWHCKGELSGINGEIRPGIVHRIDKDTTGTLIVCKTDAAHHFIAEQIASHTLTRRYVGLLTGHLKEPEGRIEAPIGRDPKDRKRMAVVAGGREAVTTYRVIEELQELTLAEFRLFTGRTHQIRVHMAHIHHPIYGDEVYGHAVKGLTGQCLHAKVLGFIHPSTGAYMEFEAPIPDYFQKLIEARR